MTTALVPKEEARALTLSSAALSIQEIVERKKLIAQVVADLMKEGEHYGLIPGAQKKSLWKPGADLLCSLFQLEPDYVAEEIIHEPGYIYYRYKCVLTHISSGRRVGSGLGSCNSREEKYVRAGAKKCPNCEKDTIFRSKPRNKAEEADPDKLGWFCWSKKGGCGRNFTADDPGVVQQDTAPKDPSDLDNTILKMACKRSRIDAVLTVTSASDFFTQDVDELTEKAAEYTPPPQAKEGSAGPKAEGALHAGTTSATTTAPQAASPSTTTSGSAPVTSKPARAPSIAHDGTFASHKQVAYLHMLKHRAGVTECKPEECGIEVEEEKKWGKKTKRIQRCAYHAQLAAFKDCDGKPITTSKNLSEAQISNLIDRYEAKVSKQEARAQETPDIAAAFDQAEENARLRGAIEEPGAEG